jgi:Domain of Unknown Function (DUF928)
MTKSLMLVGALIAAIAAAASAPDRANAQNAEAPGTAGAAYTPPLRGRPAKTVGGASRSAVRVTSPLPTIDLLAPPDHAGETFRATPTLCYFVSQPVAWPMQLTISAPLQAKPIIEVTIPSARAAGIYALRLADYRARLDPGIPYTWSVSIIRDRNAWSRNIVASAVILRVPPPPATESAATAPGLRQAAIFGHAGMWYDAVAAAFDNREADRHAMLDRLIGEAGLAKAVHFERTTAGLVRATAR